MFEIGFPELILIAVVGLLVIGPERLPEALRTLGLWVGRMRRSFTNVKAEIEKEIGMDEIRRQLHNEAVMEEMKRIERDVRDSVNAARDDRPAGDRPAGDVPSGDRRPDDSGAQAGGGAATDTNDPADGGAPAGTEPAAGGGAAREEPDRSWSGAGDEGRG